MLSPSNLQYRETSSVLLYDPKDLTEINLNLIRSNTPFESIQYVGGDVPTMLLESQEQQTKAIIQYTRLECIQAVTSRFEDRSMEAFGKLIHALPEYSVKAFGLNFTSACTLDSTAMAGQFIRDRFFTPQKDLEDLLGGPLFASSARMFFGSDREYRDVRVTPELIESNTLVLQYHYHGEEQVRDKDRIHRLLTDRYAAELPHVFAVLEGMLK